MVAEVNLLRGGLLHDNSFVVGSWENSLWDAPLLHIMIEEILWFVFGLRNLQHIEIIKGSLHLCPPVRVLMVIFMPKEITV